MAEYIEREKLIESFKNKCYEFASYNTIDTRDVIDCINAEPAADVAMVVHAKWKIVHVGRTIKCSNCGRIFDRFVNGAQLPEHCFCGAKMDGGEKANE